MKFHTFGVVRCTKATDDKSEEHQFTFGLMSRKYNSPYDLGLLNGEQKTRRQEQDMNHSVWTMQSFDKRSMYIHRF